MQDPVYTISISPDPMKRNAPVTIEYDGPPGTVLTLQWNGELSTTVTIGRHGKAVVTVPASATGLIVSDPWGNTEAASVNP